MRNTKCTPKFKGICKGWQIQIPHSVAFDWKNWPAFTWDKVFIQGVIQAGGQSTAHGTAAPATLIETWFFPVSWLEVLFQLLHLVFNHSFSKDWCFLHQAHCAERTSEKLIFQLFHSYFCDFQVFPLRLHFRLLLTSTFSFSSRNSQSVIPFPIQLFAVPLKLHLQRTWVPVHSL